MRETIIAVGAGQAAQSLAETLRQQGYEGRIILVGDEPSAPYQRPPLSKKYLLGQMAQERLYFRSESYYQENEIELMLGRRAIAIDREAKRLRLEDGESLAYDKLAITTGARPRMLPVAIGGELGGVHPMRVMVDVDSVAPQMVADRRGLIIGGGYIGLEAAAVAATIGVETVLIEQAPRILSRVAAQETSAYFAALHRSHGVDIREGVGLAMLEGDGSGRVVRAHLADGASLEIDFALVGVGVQPNQELAEAAGLTVENGIAVDETGRTSDPDIYAAGDVASFPFRGRRIRLESVQNAIDQAAIAAQAMLGRDKAYAPVPWFWSDQYDVKLQIAGLSHGFNRSVLRPGAREGAQSVWYFQGAELLAVDAMNDPRAYMTGKRWLEQGHSPDPERLADPGADLKTL